MTSTSARNGRVPANDRSDRYCIIGAGAAGLAALRRLHDAGITCEALEAGVGVGGLWRGGPADSPIFRGTCAISPKSVQAFADFPMPADYPDFPHHTQMLAYLERYAEHHDLVRHIEFDTRVARVEPAGECWSVTLQDHSSRLYRGVLIASGKHDKPYMPPFTGSFDGEVRHARYYDGPEDLAGKRVLVIGAGQSAVDLVIDSAKVSERVFHSSRRGLFAMPRYLLGRPFEEHLQSELPLKPVLTPILLPLLRRLGAPPSGCGMPKVHFRNGFPHPTVGREVFRLYQEGTVVHKPDVSGFAGRSVHFGDGTEANVDIILCATGYAIDYPFIDRKLLNWSGSAPRPDLYLHTFPPDHDSLFVLGMMQPLGAHWTTYDEQGGLVAEVIKQKESSNARYMEFRRRKQTQRPCLDGGLRFYRGNEKPICDVDKFAFRREALRETRLLRGV
jgi:thioredoxin reductase